MSDDVVVSLIGGDGGNGKPTDATGNAESLENTLHFRTLKTDFMTKCKP